MNEGMAENIGQGRGQTGGDLDSIKADLNKLRADISALTQDLVTIGRTSASEARDRATEEMRARIDQLNAAYRDTAERAKDWWRSTQHTIGQNPLPSLGVAFGAGVLIGLMLHRK